MYSGLEKLFRCISIRTKDHICGLSCNPPPGFANSSIKRASVALMLFLKLHFSLDIYVTFSGGRQQVMAICKDPAGQSSAPDVHKPPITMLWPITHNPNFLEIFCETPPSQLGLPMFYNVMTNNTQPKFS